MNQRLLLLTHLFVLTGVSATASTITFQSLLATGTWTLQNRNSDQTIGGAANGNAIAGLSDVTVTGSDVNTADPFTGIVTGGPLIDLYGAPIGTFTQFTTVISADTPGLTLAPDGITLSGDLTFNWNFTTEDAGSFYDPAGYMLLCASPTDYPSCGLSGINQLTTDIDAFFPADPLNPPLPPFAESGTVTVTLSPGDVFGAWVLTTDNANGAGTINFSAPMVSSPEPASFLLIGGGLLSLGWAGRKARLGKVEMAEVGGCH